MYLELKPPKHLFLRLLANGANKAGWVVGLPQHRNHLSLHKFSTAVASCAMTSLEVQWAEVVPIPHEEATLS